MSDSNVVEPKQMKFLSAREMVDSGVLQEANRLFFHPLGLALAAMFPTVEGIELATSLGVKEADGKLKCIDCRDDPEGFVFDEEYWQESSADSHRKAEAVAALTAQKADKRQQVFGWTVQPLPQMP